MKHERYNKGFKNVKKKLTKMNINEKKLMK